MNSADPLRLADFRSLRFSSGGHPLTRSFSQRLGAMLAWLAYTAGLAPSAVTMLGLFIFLIGAVLYATLDPTLGAAAACLALFQLAYGLDCADGQLARATATASTLGAWLDVACDHVRSIALAAAAGLWLGKNGLSPVAAALCAGAFLAGDAVHIHTATVLRGRAERSPPWTSGAAQRIREAVTVLCDTTGVLAVIAVLRASPWLLGGYLAATGALLLAVSIYLAMRRLRSAQ